MSSEITINCDIELYLKTTYETLASIYCTNPTAYETNESCVKLNYNLWLTKINYDRFCKAN